MTDHDSTEQTRVGHCKRDETDVYIGRGSGDRHLLNTQIGSRGWLGNPYPADVFGREECIEKFRSVFEERLHDEPEFREAVRDLAGETLGCWCQSVDDDGPECHGEIIAEHADRLADQEVRTDGGTDTADPFPEVGAEWNTPIALDTCPVCSCSGGLWKPDPGSCECGAEYEGLGQTTLVDVPERGERDVVVRASEEDYGHKRFVTMDRDRDAPEPRQTLCYWSVQGEPQRTGPGRAILFSPDGETVQDYAPICYVEDGKIWFDPLHSVEPFEVPAEPPTRGFTYADWGEFPW